MQSKDSRALSNSEEEEYDVDKLIDKMMALKARLMEVGRQSTLDIVCMILVFIIIIMLSIKLSYFTC